MNVTRPRPGTFRSRLSLFCFALAFGIGIVAVLQPDSDADQQFAPVVRETRLLDLLSWIPATDESLRAFSVWIDQPGDPISLSAANGELAIDPVPLALGQSVAWQQTTGISASGITGWATSPGANISILQGTFDLTALSDRLKAQGFRSTKYRSIPIWINPTQSTDVRSFNGDDARSLNAVAIGADRIVLGVSEGAVRDALDAATNARASLASGSIAPKLAADASVSGLAVTDLRDLAVGCGLANGWRAADFDGASGRSIGLTYAVDPTSLQPVTSVWIQFSDEDHAFASLPSFSDQWVNGYINSLGVGESVATFASVSRVYQDRQFIVADLVQGRENGWVRTGVKYLIASCEQASTLIPVEPPDRGTPMASPSPVEAQ